MRTSSETWNEYTNYQTPQEFMNISRQNGHSDPREAVEVYMREYAAYLRESINPDLSDEDIRNTIESMVDYLETSRGEEWN